MARRVAARIPMVKSIERARSIAITERGKGGGARPEIRRAARQDANPFAAATRARSGAAKYRQTPRPSPIAWNTPAFTTIQIAVAIHMVRTALGGTANSK